MQWINRNTQDVLGPKFKYIHDNICEDIVMIGASRCHHHYVSSIISDSLGMSVYNCGMQGSENIYSHYVTLCLILERYKPKVVCVEVMASDFDNQKDPFAKLSYFAPYFGYCSGADSVFLLGGLYWKYTISHLYRYNAKAASNIAGLFISRQERDDHGYLPVKESSVILGELTEAKTVTETDKQKFAQQVNQMDNTAKLNYSKDPNYIPDGYFDENGNPDDSFDTNDPDTKDEDGDRPTLGSFTQQSMTPFLDQLKTAASMFAGETGLTMDDLGFPSDIPSSAEAIKSAHESLRVMIVAAQTYFGQAFIRAGWLAAKLRDGIDYLPTVMEDMSPLWKPAFDVDASTLGAVGDSVLKLNQAVPNLLDTDAIYKLTGIEPSDAVDVEEATEEVLNE